MPVYRISHCKSMFFGVIMRKLIRPEFIIAAVTVLFIVFAAGFFIGRGTADDPIVVSHLQDSSSDANITAASAPADPASPDAEDTAPVSGTQEGTPPVSPLEEQGLININTATAAELCDLPGIGEVLASRIIDYRESSGGFADISEITNVSGIGDIKFDAIRELITT